MWLKLNTKGLFCGETGIGVGYKIKVAIHLFDTLLLRFFFAAFCLNFRSQRRERDSV